VLNPFAQKYESDVSDADLVELAKKAVDATSIVVKFTLYGDATLDGKADFNDLVKLAQNFNTTVSATQAGWSRGQFRRSGQVGAKLQHRPGPLLSSPCTSATPGNGRNTHP
jgi:hypothetical protein